MEIIQKSFDDKIYYLVGEFEFKFGVIYKFSNLEDTIYAKKENDEFMKITNSRILKKIEKEFESLKIEDVI